MTPFNFIIRETAPVLSQHDIVRRFPSGLKILFTGSTFHALYLNIPTVRRPSGEYASVEDLKSGKIETDGKTTHVSFCKALMKGAGVSRDTINDMIAVSTYATAYIAKNKRVPPLFYQVCYNHYSVNTYLKILDENMERILAESVTALMEGRILSQYKFMPYHAAVATIFIAAMNRAKTIEEFAATLNEYPRVAEEFETVFGIPPEKLVCG